ncbi:MAG: class I SAM-dependent methyltransferase [Alphaproteobacteria bacterium]
MLLARLLRGVIQQGELTLIDAHGARHCLGDRTRGPAVTMRLHDRRLHYKLLLNPRLYAGEAYMDGTLTIEGGSIYDFLDLIGLNTANGTVGEWDRRLARAQILWRWFQQYNPLDRAQANVAHHYDLSGKLYEIFLDSGREYSCAYFESPNSTLEAAQEAKKRHIAAKLALQPGMRVLDIGSGWGGMALYLARTAGVDVTGITLSAEQLRLSQQRAAAEGLEDRVRFFLRDYREETGKYDRIVSVGMFEHVGVPHYRTFFHRVNELLNDDGVALLHTIAHMDPPVVTNPWLRKYIFPGGYCPSLSEILPVTEQVGLWVTDVEILRLHYAETLRHWRHRFVANWDKATEIYDERFCRMWEFYLAGCEMAFRYQGQMVAQIQIAKTVDTLPITRDYMSEWECAQTPAGTGARRLKSVR